MSGTTENDKGVRDDGESVKVKQIHINPDSVAVLSQDETQQNRQIQQGGSPIEETSESPLANDRQRDNVIEDLQAAKGLETQNKEIKDENDMLQEEYDQREKENENLKEENLKQVQKASEIFNISSSNKQYTSEERKQFAEGHGDFIISMMKRFASYDKIGPAANRNGKFEFKHVREEKRGLYMFYLVSQEKTSRKLPIYVGQTMREFSDRFKDKDLNHVFKWFDPDKFYLYAFVCELTNPQASFMKAMFLDVFNFVLNSVGSDYKRKDLHNDKIYSREESWKIVEEKWGNIKIHMSDVFRNVEYMRRED